MISNTMLRTLYTNADQFLNKRDLLSAQITGSHPPDIIIITELLPKSPNSTVSSALLALPGYSLYVNFDPDTYDNNNNISLYRWPPIITTTFPYLGGLPKVGSERGAWPESGWPADQVTMGLAFFHPF